MIWKAVLAKFQAGDILACREYFGDGLVPEVMVAPDHVVVVAIPESRYVRAADTSHQIANDSVIVAALEIDDIDSYRPPVMLTHEGDSQGAEFVNLWLPVGGHGYGCSDRIAGRL